MLRPYSLLLFISTKAKDTGNHIKRYLFLSVFQPSLFNMLSLPK